jgi:hypothetical protein
MLRASVMAVTLVALAGCGADPPRAVLPVGPAPGLDDLISPGTEDTDPAAPSARTVLGIADRIETDYPVVQVWRADADRQGRLIVYAVRFRLDDRSDHPRFEDWNAHVRRAARDQREAVVAMLKRTVARLRRVRLVSVYQDEGLQPFWNRPQIEALDDPRRYRRFEAWQDLVLSAAVLPGRPGG